MILNKKKKGINALQNNQAKDKPYGKLKPENQKPPKNKGYKPKPTKTQPKNKQRTNRKNIKSL